MQVETDIIASLAMYVETFKANVLGTNIIYSI
jgi:hypothetical protein